MSDRLGCILLLLLACSVGVSAACSAPTPYSYGAGCFAQCPWNNTLVTYLVTATSTCLTSIVKIYSGCSSVSLYADDSTKTCVSSTNKFICSMSFFAYHDIQGHFLQTMCPKLLYEPKLPC